MRGLRKGKIREKIYNRINILSALYIAGLSALLTLIVQKHFAWLHMIGIFLLCVIMISIQYKDILRYKPIYIRKRKMLFLLGLILLLTFILGRATDYLLTNFSRGIGFVPGDTIIYGIPLAFGAMLATLLLDIHTAITFSFMVGIIAGLWQQDANYTFFAFIGSLIATFGVMRCRRRSDIVKAGLSVSLANVVTVIVIILLSDKFYIKELLPSLFFASISGVAGSALVGIFLPLLEHLFKTTTDIKLLEFLDLDHPLMKRLMIDAPGTYHHSMIVANLMDAAAEAVNVNPLLARISAYYHDIGKMRMPEYFVENQSGLFNKHDKLMPHLSCMVIISHVKEGLEMAEEYNLPEPVKQAITEHHGTSLISYFYSKAKEGQTDPPNEADYRYSGPRPQSRVTGLLIMADAIEAASRVLKDPTSSRIKGLVDKIVEQIFLDGQLDECELTLKDLHKIKERFAFILNSIFHRRIEYPSFKFNEPSTDKEGDNGRGSHDTAKKQTEKDKTRPQQDKPMDEPVAKPA